MATQREVPYTGTVRCTCGKMPRCYVTDYTKYHNECYPCQHITMRLSTIEAANEEFARMMEVKQFDTACYGEAYAIQGDLSEVEANVLSFFERGSRA